MKYVTEVCGFCFLEINFVLRNVGCRHDRRYVDRVSVLIRVVDS